MSEIQVKFSGNDISPETIPLKELSEILLNFESTITPIVSMQNSNLPEDRVLISLANIQKSSLVLTLSSPDISFIKTACLFLGDLISSNKLHKLPYRSVEAFKKLYNFIKKRKVNMELIDALKTIAKLSFNDNVTIPDKLSIFGETTIYGKIIRVGGREPKVLLEVSEKETISCTAKENVVKELASKLYEFVGLTGEAEWSSDDISIQSFDIKEIESCYEFGDICKSMSILRTEYGRFFENINPENFVKECRED